MNIRIHLVAGLLAITASLGLAQTTITFDERSFDSNTPIENGYQSLNWSNFHAFDPLTKYAAGTTGYNFGTISSANVAFNAYGNPAAILAIGDSTFDVFTGYFTAAWTDGLGLHVEAFLDGTSVGTFDTTLSTTVPSLIALNFTGIDQLTFSTSNGGQGAHFAMDNLKVTAIPEPSTYAVIFGLGFLALALWRRQRR